MLLHIRITLIISLAALALFACQGSGSQPDTLTIRMSMTEFAFNPVSIETQEGQQLTLEMVNDGALPHEIMFGRDVVVEGGRPSRYMNDMFAAAGIHPEVSGVELEEHLGHEGFSVVLQPGEQATLTFTSNSGSVGEWEFGCFEQDGVHYDSGMKGTLIVK